MTPGGRAAGLTAASTLAVLAATTPAAAFKAGIAVANLGSNSVTTYAGNASGNANPRSRIRGRKTRLNQPTGIAVNGAGVMAVANYGDNSVTVYKPRINGNVSPVATIRGAKTRLNRQLQA